MAIEATSPSQYRTAAAARQSRAAALGDKIFYYGTMAFAGSVLLFCILIFGQLVLSSRQSIHHFGWGFVIGENWDPQQDIYSALPFIYGTLVSSFLALLIAVPIGLGTAIFLAELAPQWMRQPVSFLVELLAAVPSVVYGLWGIFIMVPALKPIEQWVSNLADGSHFAHVTHLNALFDLDSLGYNMFAAALILAIMVLPFITAVSREVLLAVPSNQREAAFGLGATHWEAIKGPMLRYARTGITGAIILGLARALGETMAVTMVIGNSNNPVNVSLFSSAATLSSVIANQFAEATQDLEVSALLEIALILFCITIIVNAIARLLIWNTTRTAKGSTRG